MFRPYMHVEKFGNDAVEGIELGKVFVFPKIDGTNASVWWNNAYDFDQVRGGSRTRELSFDADNAGFLASLYRDDSQQNIWRFLNKNPWLRLYGEWLVPHTFKGYRDDAWKKLYIFDVFNDQTQQYLSYDAYQPMLQEAGLLYIPPLAIVNNGDYERFIKYLNENRFLCPDSAAGGNIGEGIVLKNYDYYNKYNEQVWAKFIRQEFKEAHHRLMGAPEINAGLMNEERILDRALTDALVEKTICKIIEEEDTPNGNRLWQSKWIPTLFGRVFYDIIREELWDALKDINYGSVNFKTLKAIMIMRIKQMKPEIFK